MLATIQKVFSVIMAVLAALGASTTLNVSAIAPILAKIAALLASLSSLKSPTDVDSALADLVSALSALKTSGLIADTTPLDEALAVIAKYEQVEADYKSGQVALLDSNFSFDGVEGDLIAIAKGGSAAATLGL
jgi:hypothetical protein